jgi:thiamine-phosphate pyrophosphorylase
MSRSHLIHANTHRVKEGARVIEDIARFILRDEFLFHQIRDLRHSLANKRFVDLKLEDIGGASFIEDNIRANLFTIVEANIIRIQEALRVLEEFSDESDEKHRLKTLRYRAYQIQSSLQKKLKCFLNNGKLKGLYLIIDTDIIKRPIEEIIRIINQTSVHVVQLRNKTLSKYQFIQQALQLKKGLDPEKLLIINDNIDVALDLGDGLHIGQEDYMLKRVRGLLPEQFILGISCHNLKEAKEAIQIGATYISVGCIFDSKSKLDTQATSIDTLAEIKSHASIPVCAIGGIHPENIDRLSGYSMDMIAMLSGVWDSSNPLEQITKFNRKLLSYSCPAECG